MTIARWLVLSLLVVACGREVPPSTSQAPTPSSRPYELICGELERADCEDRASRAVAHAAEQSSGATIVSLRFHGPSGSYELWFDDGTVIAVFAN